MKHFHHREVFEKSNLEGIYGVSINYFNGLKDIPEWDKLSENQKHDILYAIDEIDAGKGIPNKVVIDKFRKKYSNS
jgi:hypothetical protein